jgi:hypothetical protein
MKLILNLLTWMLASAAWAVAPTEFELGESSRWAAAKFKAETEPATPSPGLYVLANNDPVQLNARYRIPNLDSGEAQTLPGRELREPGLLVTIRDRPGDIVITYAKAK